MPPIVRAFVFPPDFNVQTCDGARSERQIIAASSGIRPEKISRKVLTGVDVSALQHFLSIVLDTDEQPQISFIPGGFNYLYRFVYPSSGRDVVARIPSLPHTNAMHIESTVAVTLFAQHYCNIPVPNIIAWHGDFDNPIRVPFIIMEFLTRTVNGWVNWRLRDCDTQAAILERLAYTHVAFLHPLPAMLTGPWPVIGVLGFAEGALDSASLESYTLKPIRVLRPIGLGLSLPRYPMFTPSSTSLGTVWRELWEFNRTQCLWDEPVPGFVNVAWNSYGYYECTAKLVPLAEFLEVAAAVQKLMEDVLGMLEENPSYTAPCLARNDYALRNVLLDEHTLEVKSFIDFDDVAVAPLILHRLFPLDILEFSRTGLPKSAPFYHGGAFEDFPPDEFGPNFDPDDLLNFAGGFEAQQRILGTAHRTLYRESLSTQDARIAEPAFWSLRDDAVKLHELLIRGTELWWFKKDWLLRRAMGGC